MTVYEILTQKYLEWLKHMRKYTWQNIVNDAKAQNIHPAQEMYMCLEITDSDIKNNGGYNGELYDEIAKMHSAKLLASNKHRQAHGQVTKYWLTKKGFKALNEAHEIC